MLNQSMIRKLLEVWWIFLVSDHLIPTVLTFNLEPEQQEIINILQQIIKIICFLKENISKPVTQASKLPRTNGLDQDCRNDQQLKH